MSVGGGVRVRLLRDIEGTVVGPLGGLVRWKAGMVVRWIAGSRVDGMHVLSLATDVDKIELILNDFDDRWKFFEVYDG